MAKVAWIGLGVMGYPMAGHLKTKGNDEVVVFNRNISKAESWVKQYGGSLAKTPKLAAENADIIISCVGNDNDLREVAIGKDGAFHAMKKGAIYIDHTTASAIVARELSQKADEIGGGFLDAPVSGGQAGAVNGVLSIMVGGTEANFAKAQAFMAHYSRTCGLVGEVGAGQLAKMVNQICIAGLVQALSEAINFGQVAGLDMEKVISIIKGGAAQSWQMENRYKTMLDDKFDFGFAVDWMRKDLGICLNQAQAMGVSLPVAALVDQFYAQVQMKGGNRHDTSALISNLRKP